MAFRCPRRPFHLLMTAVLMALLAGPAIAQGVKNFDQAARSRGSLGRLEQYLTPDLYGRDLPIMVDGLGLDESQRTIAETLLTDYMEAFDEITADLRTSMEASLPEAIRSDQLRRKRRAIVDQMKEVREKTRELGERGREGDTQARKKLERHLEDMRQQMSSLQPARPTDEQITRLLDQAQQWTNRTRHLRDEFFSGLRSILNEEQLEKWPAFRRMFRRFKTMRYGRYSGESVDLFAIVRDIQTEPSTERNIQPLLDEYAVALDAKLVARNDHLDDAILTRIRMMDAGHVDEVMARAREESRLRAGVRDVNEHFAEILARSLDQSPTPEIAAALRGEYLVRAFPRVYRTTATHRSFQIALELEDLDETAHAGILTLQEAFLVDMDTHNRTLCERIREAEPNREIDRLKRRAEMEAGDRSARQKPRSEDPVRAGFRERSETESRYREPLESMLTPEQVAMLPATRERRSREGKRSEQWREEIKRYDRDGDGELSRKERDAARDAARKLRRKERQQEQ